MRGAGYLCVIGLAVMGQGAPVMAEVEHIPVFDECFNGEIARYERNLRRWQRGPWAEKFEIGDVGGVDVCGTSGIILCDRSDAPLPCQHELAAQQDVIREQVLQALPLPEEVRGRAGQWSDALYPQVYALAHGISAGPDCAGSTEVMDAWCVAREASLALQNAVLCWQLARFLDAAPTAVVAGWAAEPLPVRPQGRPGDKL